MVNFVSTWQGQCSNICINNPLDISVKLFLELLWVYHLSQWTWSKADPLYNVAKLLKLVEDLNEPRLTSPQGGIPPATAFAGSPACWHTRISKPPCLQNRMRQFFLCASSWSVCLENPNTETKQLYTFCNLCTYSQPTEAFFWGGTICTITRQVEVFSLTYIPQILF